MSDASGAVTTAADAYVWGYPLVVVHRTRARHPAAAIGSLVARDRLATAKDRLVVAPNNDTLYASGWFDLADGDLTIELGEIDDDRYWSVMLLDAYTHVRYVSRRTHGSAGLRVRVTLDPAATHDGGPGAEVVPMPTRTVWVLARVLVDGPDDLVQARHVLGRLHVCQEHTAPRTETMAASGDDGFFAELRAALTVDPPAPWHPALPSSVAALLDHLPAPDVLAEGAREGEARILAMGAGADRFANGWGTRSRGADFGHDVAYRAAFARVSLAGHLPVENRGYSRPVDGTRRWQLRFPPGGDPPVGGFWSLCIYGPDLFLVDNELDRFSIGDRTAGLRREPDGSLVVTIGHARPEASANWLPAPDGPGFLVLRAYEGAPEIVDATWFPPELVEVQPPAATP